MYTVTHHGRRVTNPDSLHRCLLYIHVKLNGLIHWRDYPGTCQQAVDAGYSIVRT
jgi:hypothetical protein